MDKLNIQNKISYAESVIEGANWKINYHTKEMAHAELDLEIWTKRLKELKESEHLVKCQIPNCLSGELVDGRYKRQVCDKCEEHLLG